MTADTDLEDRIESGLSLFNRIYGVYAGIIILGISAVLFAVFELTPAGEVFGGITWILLILDAFAVYWIITGIKPELAVTHQLSERTAHSQNQYFGLFMSLFLLISVTYMISTGADLGFLVFYVVMTSPILIFTYHVWFGIDRFTRFNERLERELEEA